MSALYCTQEIPLDSTKNIASRVIMMKYEKLDKVSKRSEH